MRLVVACAALALASVGAACREGGVAPRSAVPGGDVDRGRIAIAAYGCGGCHVIPGIRGADGRVGPPLLDLAHRTFIAGSLRNDAETLVKWIQAPPTMRPGTAMPVLGVTEGHARDIAAYLYAQQRGGLGPPHLLPREWLPGH